MDRGLRSLFESSTFILALGVVVLLSGMGYGAYTAHNKPEVRVQVMEPIPGPADAAPATKP
ncbi:MULTISPECIES: hypothetical protein [unclassified Comamonas]|jgi:hypothetical protein|uniref:hypothetical protein n=1 Tax=unclassified Comamonas TaxID=2638500 RepID=UPI00177AAE5A|nr:MULTISPECIES: hypothetical protein [unclassified Comamonas]MBD9403125.1 hypothetical protein [Comamonas sp. CMM02]